MRRHPLRLLTIAGSDCSGGAGLQLDLKTFAAHGGYGMSVVTAVTAQNPREVSAIHIVPPAMVAAQLAAVAEVGVDAIKIGMLGDEATVRVVSDLLRALWNGSRSVPIVLDPVLRSTSGTELLTAGALPALLEQLVPLVTLVTPNLDELGVLTGTVARDETERVAAAQSLVRRGPAVLAKGGHQTGPEVIDLLVTARTTHRFAQPRLPGRSFHGTGCALSAAIAARLAAGEELAQAVAGAIAAVREAIRAAPDLGCGPAPVDPQAFREVG